MTVERGLRGVAGVFVALSVTLSYFHSPYWLFFTLFVGLNLLQSAFTNWCPMVAILRGLKVPACCDNALRAATLKGEGRVV